MHNLYVCIVKVVNTGRRMANTGFANTGEGTFSKIWAGLSSKSGILKTCGVSELSLDMGSRIKKNRFGYRNVPLRE